MTNKTLSYIFITSKKVPTPQTPHVKGFEQPIMQNLKDYGNLCAEQQLRNARKSRKMQEVPISKVGNIRQDQKHTQV